MVSRARRAATVVLGVLGLLLLVACPPQTPHLGAVTPDPLELSAQVGEIVMSTVSFENTGEAALTYDASETADWLEISSGSSGTVAPSADATLDLSATCPAAPSELSTVVAVASNGGDGDVTVDLRCEGIPEISDPTPDPLELEALVDASTTGSITFDSVGNAPPPLAPASACQGLLELLEREIGPGELPGNSTMPAVPLGVAEFFQNDAQVAHALSKNYILQSER